MIYDTVEFFKTPSLSNINTPSTVTVTYLSQQDGDNPPGFYSNVDGVWAPFGGAGGTVKSFVFTSTDLLMLDLATCNPEGLLLSTLVVKNVAGTRSISLILTSTQEVLETVILTNTYTTIVVPQPHSLYSLLIEADLTVTLKTI